MSFTKHLLTAFLSVSILFSGFSQSGNKQKKNFILEPRIHYGNVLPFYDAIKYLVHHHARGLELRLGYPTYGKNYWEKIYRYPVAGMGYSFWNLGNPEVFGYAHALYGYFDASLFKLQEIFQLDYEISFGASYLTKTFEVEDNYLNRAIGAHVNVYFRIGFDAKMKITERARFSLESGFSHFSNGKIKSPNYGLNALTGSVGINYLFGNSSVQTKEPEIPNKVHKVSQSLIYCSGMKVYDNLLGTKYFLSSLSYNLDWVLTLKRKIGLGADLFYDASISEAMAVDGVKNKNVANFFRFGIHASHQVQYKKIILGIDLGYYLYSKYTDLSLVYSRLSIQYLIRDHLLANISLKSHLAKADFIEWGIGYRW